MEVFQFDSRWEHTLGMDASVKDMDDIRAMVNVRSDRLLRGIPPPGTPLPVDLAPRIHW